MFKMDIENRVASKGIAVVPYNIEKVIEFLQNEETLLKINGMLIEIKVIHEVKD